MAGQIDATGTFGQQLVPGSVQLPADGVANDQHPFGAIKCGPVLVAFLHIRRPDPLFEDELLRLAASLRRIFEYRVLSVAKLLVVIEERLAAQAGRLRGMRRDAQAPTGDIDVMDAIVADVSTAKVVPPP